MLREQIIRNKKRKKPSNISKGTKLCRDEQILRNSGTNERRKRRVLRTNSPTSEADQNFDQFISPSHPKYYTKS
jgi:hypothetical protein